LLEKANTLRVSPKLRPTVAQQLGSVSGRSAWPFERAARQLAIPRKNAWKRRLSEVAKRTDGVPSGETRDERAARAEAVLFLAREPLSTRRLAQLAGLADGTEARTLIRRLNRWYDTIGSAFRAEELAGGFQLMTRGRFGPWLRKSLGSPAEIRLSAPALETLAIVAYRQPVMRAEIEAVRGVDCGEILRQLMDRDLVRTAGRAEELGRPYRYATTRRFLQAFGLRHLDDLPRADVLRTPRPTSEQSKATTLDQPRDSGQAHNAIQPELREAEEEF
jgi:segregation and condensation protein B